MKHVESTKAEFAQKNGKWTVYHPNNSVDAFINALLDHGIEDIGSQKLKRWQSGCRVENMNAALRKYFKMIRRYYAPKERMKLSKFNFDNLKAVVRVGKNYIYVSGDTYYSNFKCKDEEVEAIWIIVDLAKWEKEVEIDEINSN